MSEYYILVESFIGEIELQFTGYIDEAKRLASQLNGKLFNATIGIEVTIHND
jgi:hypothetical protein